MWTKSTVSYDIIFNTHQTGKRPTTTIASRDVGRTGWFWHTAGKKKIVTGFVGIPSSDN